MFSAYEFDKYDYVSIHQNYIKRLLYERVTAPDEYDYDYGHEVFYNRPIDSNETRQLVDFLKSRQRKKELLVWDARRIFYAPIHTMDSVFSLICDNGYKGILFVHDDNGELKSLVLQTIRDRGKPNAVLDNIGENCCFWGEEEVYKRFKENMSLSTIVDSVNSDINRYIFNQLKSNEKEMTPIYSSNVYANRYFNVKRAFCEPELFAFIIYRLAAMIKQIVDLIGNDFDAFVCASLNGACLASALSAIYRKPVVFLRNIGPSMKANDEKMLERIEKKKKYLFIFDFMCMGTEHQRVKMLCNIRRSQLIYSVGISHYRYPGLVSEYSIIDYEYAVNRDLKIATLFFINAFDKTYYHCKIDKGGEKNASDEK